jgi:hypothetical protein
VSDGKGGTRTERRTETYTVRVTDFQYKIDLTQFICLCCERNLLRTPLTCAALCAVRCSRAPPPAGADPYGYITSVDEKCLTVPDLFERFVADTNLLKAVSMRKEVPTPRHHQPTPPPAVRLRPPHALAPQPPDSSARAMWSARARPQVQFDFRALHAMVYGCVAQPNLRSAVSHCPSRGMSPQVHPLARLAARPHRLLPQGESHRTRLQPQLAVGHVRHCSGAPFAPPS